MIPIYEQGQGRGIGHNLTSFLQRFDRICKEHLEQKRAGAFGFIFYDFTDSDLRKILKDQGVFAQLDRLTGNKLSLFYLHTGRKDALVKFNEVFLSKLGVIQEAKPPCVVFFKVNKEQIEDVAVAQLDSANLINGFHELYAVIDRYIQSSLEESDWSLRSLKRLQSSAKFLSLETLRIGLKKGIEIVIG